MSIVASLHTSPALDQRLPLLGPRMVWAGRVGFSGVAARIDAQCQEIASQGRRPCNIPIEGSTPLGLLGYVRAADELEAQLADGQTRRRKTVTAS